MLKLFTISIFCSFLFFELNAQDTPDTPSTWIKEVSTDALTLPTVKQGIYNKIMQMEGYENPIAIDVKSIAKSISGDGSLSFSLPTAMKSLKARSINIDAKSVETYVWMGEFEDDMGSMTVVSDQGKVRAHISYGEETYEIFPVDKDMHVLMKVKNKPITGNECATPHTTSNIETIKNDAPSSNARIIACPERIRVLALTTTAARTADPNLNQTIALAISQFNQARSNSQITSQANLTLAEIRDTDFVEDAGDIVADRDAIIANGGFQDLRDDANADIVLMFTNGNYTGGITGIAGTLTLNPELAYAIVEIPEATTIYTATHETGHLFGARHQTCTMFYNPGCDNTSGFMHGFRYSYGAAWWIKRRITMMHQNRYQHTRVLNFSNPNISDHGRAMGTTNSEHNARWISEHANQVSQFRVGGGIMSVSIDGPGILDLDMPFGDYEAVVQCGDAPYSYAWRVSADGFNYGSVLGTGETFGHFSFFESFYLRLTVTSDDGQQRDYTRFILFDGPGGFRTSEEPTEEINSIAERRCPWEMHILILHQMKHIYHLAYNKSSQLKLNCLILMANA